VKPDVSTSRCFDVNDIKEVKANKFYTKGGFNNRIILEETN
jgi:hypothetical protein